jgi:hypothetical protein
MQPSRSPFATLTSAARCIKTLPYRIWHRAFIAPLRERQIRSSLSYIASLKDRHRGKRGFVIGNGPSLRLADLERIGSEVSIASNKIYLAFEKVAWRPTYFTIVDDMIWERSQAELARHGLVPIVTSYLRSKPTPHHVVRYLGDAPDDWLSGKGDRFSADLTSGFYGGRTVTYENLQLAMHLGLDPIIIVGCDHHYPGDHDMPNTSTAAERRSPGNHFLPNYYAPGEKASPALIDKMTIAYEIAARYARAHGRTIMNATRGGHLNAFPRADFDELFSPEQASSRNAAIDRA